MPLRQRNLRHCLRRQRWSTKRLRPFRDRADRRCRLSRRLPRGTRRRGWLWRRNRSHIAAVHVVSLGDERYECGSPINTIVRPVRLSYTSTVARMSAQAKYVDANVAGDSLKFAWVVEARDVYSD